MPHWHCIVLIIIILRVVVAGISDCYSKESAVALAADWLEQRLFVVASMTIGAAYWTG